MVAPNSEGKSSSVPARVATPADPQRTNAKGLDRHREDADPPDLSSLLALAFARCIRITPTKPSADAKRIPEKHKRADRRKAVSPAC